MHTLVYDGTFIGFLTAVFEVYEYKYTQVDIQAEHKRQDALFGETTVVITDDERANRVWKGLKQRISADAYRAVFYAFLSELPGVENQLLKFIQYAFSQQDAERNYSNTSVLFVMDTAKKVGREKHRMEAFVRFQLTGDGLYYAIIEPDFNVLPLIAKHFTKRYADQRWMIYDTRRKYGLYYDLSQTTTVTVDFNDAETTKEVAAVLGEKEPMYQQLWQQYFKSTNIVARKNTKLHIKHMPKRYWKYLTEKQIGL